MAKKDRTWYLEQILVSKAPLKLIVAGPGTGKSYTFKCLLRKNGGNNLVFTLTNALSRDMAKDLGDLAETRTFHSYCRKLLHKLPLEGIDQGFLFFPKLYLVIERDIEILNVKVGDGESELNEAFQSLNESDRRISFFLERAKFYNAVGFDDSVYRVLSAFRKNRDFVPSFDQVVVDEFQDFNALEVEFIKHLETRNQILIAGDDDQAIYDFRNASPDYLRKMVHEEKYKRFSLPYCSRCPNVVVKTINHIISQAQKVGTLIGRIEKPYYYHPSDKEIDSKRYPKLIWANCSVQRKNAPYLAKYIEKVIRGIPDEDVNESKVKNYPLALIIGPSHYLDQVNDFLKDNVPGVLYKLASPHNITLLDGYLCLLKNKFSNLGWRVLVELEDPEGALNVVQSTAEKCSLIFNDLPNTFAKRHLVRLELLTRISKNPDALNAVEQDELERYFETNINQIFFRVRSTDDEVETETSTETGGQIEAENPIIQLTTYNACKGLSAGHVFVIGLEEGVFPKKSVPTDNEICQFIVALTRTRKQCHLITLKNFSGKWRKPSVFQSWLPTDSFENLEVKKDFFA